MKRESLISRLRSWLNNLPIQDPIDRRVAALLQVTLIGLVFVIILAALVFVAIPDLSVQEKLNALVSDLFGLSVVALPLVLLRRGYFHSSLVIMIIILIMTPTLAVTVAFDLLNSGGILFQFTLAITMSGLLMSRRALALTFGLSAIVVGFSAIRGASVSPQLTDANVIAAVNFILFNGLIVLLLDRFGVTLRTALTDALKREGELQKEIIERKQADEKLRAAEESYRSLVENTLEGMGRATLDGKMLAANPALVRLNGYNTEAELISAVNNIAAEWYVDPNRRTEFLRLLEEDGEIRNFESEIYRHKTRERIWISESARLVRDEEGHPLWLEAAVQDITQRKQAEQALRESEERYRLFIQHSTEAIYLYDVHTRQVLDANPAFLNLLGYSSAEAAQLTLYDIVAHPPANIDTYYEQLMKQGSIIIGERKWRRKDGTILDVYVTVNQIPQSGKRQAFVLAHDITERKHMEVTLRESEEKFRLISEQSLLGISIIQDGQIKYANKAVADINGHSVSEMLGWTQVDFGKLIHPEDLPFAVEQARKKQRGDLDVVLHYEYRLITRGGELKWVDQYSNSIFYGGRPADLITIIDITERKQAEEALSLSRAQLLANLDNTPNVAVQWYDREGQILYWNPASEALYGWKSVEAVGKTLDQLIHTPKEQAGFMNILAEIQAAGKPYGPYEARVHRRDNTNGWVLATTFSIPIQDGQIGFVCMDVDITERKQAEEKLERQNQRLKALREIDTAILAAGSMESIVSAALSHVRELIDCSRSGLALIDWEKNEALNFDVHTDKATSVPKGARTSLTPIQDTLQILSQNQPIMVNDLTILPDPPPLIQALLKEGLRSVCLLPLFSQGALIGTFSMSSEIPGFFDEEKISLGREVANQVAIAITQNDLLEALRQSNVELEEHAVERENLIAELTAKNAELERFTYTVSHDLKSPLVTIKGFLGYLEQDMLTGNIERLKTDSKRIGSAVEKMQELLNDLLELSRVGRFINLPEAIPFDELARAAMELVAGHLAEHNVTVQIQPNLPVVNVDRQRLIEVLQNLLDNAAKYMGGQAEPLIEIGQRGEDAEAGQPVFFIKDNGMGVAPEYHERIFGLFNKLDPRSEGTGVGLALVKRIIEVHEGRIWIESELGKGSTFYFTLPVKEVSA